SDPYVSPVRFSDLRFYNPDIYAWLFIPGTDISLPLLQHSSDDSFYLSHAPDGSESSSGSLYTEARWSDLMFEKPVSIIYGRRTADRLGTLQRYYSENDSLDRYSDLYVFTPDERLHYRVFCASEFSSIYIPQYYRGFSDQKNISSFISDVLSYHTMIRQAVDGYVADSDNRILVLVTGLSQKEDKRFLVLAELVDETG
ncbi:MAG: class B sortase, partial [Oscillospiraceae bacterium]|nr:class B sortase [Oscillospiraceae bacterium]